MFQLDMNIWINPAHVSWAVVRQTPADKGGNWKLEVQLGGTQQSGPWGTEKEARELMARLNKATEGGGR